MSAIGTIRLTAAQTEEMNTMGFPNASKYLQWKLDNITPEEAGMKLESLNGWKDEQSSRPIASQNIEQAVRLTKAESEAERLRNELSALKNASKDTLGNLDNVVNERVQAHIKEMEHLQLKHDNEKLILEAKHKDQEHEKVKAELEDTKQKIKTMELVKQFTPLAQPILAGLGRGIQAMQNGGGFAALLSGFDSMGETPGLPSLSAEDEGALELGKNLQSMFTEDELSQVLFSVALMGSKKELIRLVPQFINKVTSENNTPAPHTQENENYSNQHNTEFEEIENEFEQ